MARGKRILIGASCVALLLISWIVAANTKSAEQKQIELMDRAAALMADRIFVRAVPLLEEAVGYNTKFTAQAEEELKSAYLALIATGGYRRKYTALLESQMSRDDARPNVFVEAANYYFGIPRIAEALEVLRDGIEKTGSQTLITLYEHNRYKYEINRKTYDYASAIFESKSQVMSEGYWGIAGSDGILLIPCQYDKISTFSMDRAIVQQKNEIFAINIDNNRISLFRGIADDFGNFANDRVPLMIDGQWHRATGEFIVGSASFEQVGMYAGGYAAAKIDEKWGVVDLQLNWLIPPEHDGIVQDELGRCYSNGAVFARDNSKVCLYVDGIIADERYEDARPFSDEGYAAVKLNGKWGFIDREGNVAIGFMFDDALSFGQHLAAVRQGEHWGYISLSGIMVIEPVFLEAKSFSNGSAPVLTERGWQFITLLEYKKGASL